MQYFVLHISDFFSIWYISPFSETPSIELKKFYFNSSYWLSLFSFTKIALFSGCLWHLKKASCAISQEESRFKILFKEFIFLFCNINKARIYNFDKKICLLENSRTELKGIRNTVFCIFLKGIRNTVFCIF